jgi:hypothetical protein
MRGTPQYENEASQFGLAGSGILPELWPFLPQTVPEGLCSHDRIESPRHAASRQAGYLSLTLFVTGIAANHVHASLAADDLAVFADPFDASADFHRTAR